MRKMFLSVIAAFAGIVMASQAHAAACSTSEISLTIDNKVYAPASCATGVVATGGPKDEVPSLDSALGQPSGVLLADDSGDKSSFQGITFSLSVNPNKSDMSEGTWTLSWSDTIGQPNLPAVFDLLVGVYGGSNGDGYLLTDVALPITPDDGTGSFDITFLNKGGNVPDFSHMILAGTYMGTPQTVNDVPEPMTLAAIGSGLLGLGLVRHKRRVT